ncbi:histidine phosphatase family protein [Aeromicrobium sp. YIM 150415]|uniref:Histidine phosphatase family protein n=1 Tax=Aeromicrobium piscarium TaxID=2590901 RepID=A0A554RFD7_9ACTN|nr:MULTISPECIES: histidine phosphatase family protein [Aeromicrobium]MBM9463087.1 histidine phosphatase family protein [Aeromicrobium sp. YIM 150415]TSD52835.1 histidine phosphatase family protein [Aeromicrobium piscarium]
MNVLAPDAELWIVRHGQTEWSREWRHTSFTDLPLTEEGERQAETLRPALADIAFDRVLTSPRQRAQRTAELAGFDEAIVDPDLVEWDYGDYEGLTTETIRESVPDWTVWTHPCPNGESAREVGVRLDRVVDLAREPGRTLVFAHGHSLRVLAARWLGLVVEQGRIFDLDTATYSVLSADRGTPVVKRWNVTSW